MTTTNEFFTDFLSLKSNIELNKINFNFNLITTFTDFSLLFNFLDLCFNPKRTPTVTSSMTKIVSEALNATWNFEREQFFLNSDYNIHFNDFFKRKRNRVFIFSYMKVLKQRNILPLEALLLSITINVKVLWSLGEHILNCPYPRNLDKG